MRDTVICKNITPRGTVCKNIVTINTEDNADTVSGSRSYAIKCSRCDNEVCTVLSISLPIVRCGYAERVPY